jgi:predicted NAD-dependent protein-ADP-ribosyltransferase YbiA (DUF1768 family)
MTTKVELFDTNSVPFGDLSNNAITPFYKDEKLWKSVTHYVYANLLRGTNKTIIMNTQLKDLKGAYERHHNKALLSLTTNILENGVRTLVSENTQFRDMLLQTGNKRLIYITNNILFGQADPLLGTTRDGKGLNQLGLIYEMIRSEEKHKKNISKDAEKNREQSDQIIKIILLTKILQSEMLTKFNDLDSLVDKSFDLLYDQYQYEIDGMTHLNKVLLDQYYSGRLVNNKLIQQIENDLDNIIYYVRNYYRDQFKLKLYYTRRRALIEYFLKEQLKKRHPSQFNDNARVLDHELDSQLNTIYKRGVDFTKQLFDNIIKLYDDGVLKIPSELSEKYTSNIDTPVAKKETTPLLPDDVVENSDPERLDAIDDHSDQNPEIAVLQQMSAGDDDRVPLARIVDLTSSTADIEHQETINYIIFTDNPGPFQILSPYHTGRFSDGFQYPNLISYYYVKLIYSLGNIVQAKSDVRTLPGGRSAPELMITMARAHRFIMIPECHNVEMHCDQFDMNNYITDFSNLPSMIIEIENRNKVLLLETALKAKFDRNHNLQVLLTQNPSKTMDFQYAESPDPARRYDEIIGIGPDGRGKNYTGKLLSKLRTKYLNEQGGTDQLNKDIAFLAHLFQNDSQLIGWFYSRGFDILNTMILVFLSTKHIPNSGEKYEINGEFIKTILHYLYDSCNVSFDQFIELEVPEQFFVRINDEFAQKFRTYTRTSSTAELPVILSSNAIVEIWKYCTWLMYQLLLESSRHKQKNNIKLFLTNIVLNMTENDSKCSLRSSAAGDSDAIGSLRNIKTCIISSIINVLKSLIIIYFNKLGSGTAIDITMINSIANIIVGKSIELKPPSDQSDIFDAVLSKYPTLLHYINKSNNQSQTKHLIQQLNTIYDYLERQSSDSFDVTQLENQRIRNRINFFSSIPTQHPQSMIPGVASASDSSDDDDDHDLLSQLQIMANLGPIDINSAPILSTQLKPPGIGRSRKTGIVFSESVDTPLMPINRIPDHTDGILGSIEQQRVMKDLNDEFGDDTEGDLIEDDEPLQTFQEDDYDDEENIGSGGYD